MITMPFEIGNGIMARLVSDYIMISRDIFHPVVFYDGYDRYNKALDSISVDHYHDLSDHFLENEGSLLKKINSFVKLYESRNSDNHTVVPEKVLNSDINQTSPYKRL